MCGLGYEGKPMNQTVINLTNDFKTLFTSIAPSKNRYTVFSNFIFLTAAALRNAVGHPFRHLFNQDIEKEYLKVISAYTKDEAGKFANLMALYVCIAEAGQEPHDHLGDLFMQQGFGEACKGQYFTPSPISDLMAKITTPDIAKALEHKNFLTVSDPACGAGSTLLAVVKEFRAQKVNPQYQLWIQGIDIDRTAALMCYIQLSMWHIPAEICVGNSLSLEIREVWNTPAHYLGGWSQKLVKPNKLPLSVTKPREQQEIVIPAQPTPISERSSQKSNKAYGKEQLGFDFQL